MEDSQIQAKFIDFYYNKIINYKQYNNIKDLDIQNYNFGDLISLYYYRGAPTHIIGKEGKLIKNPDYSQMGYLSIPFEITKYLDNATYKFKNIYYNDIDLRLNDKYVINKIGIIPEIWNYKIIYSPVLESFFVKYPNGLENTFDVNNISPSIINDYYKSSLES